MGRPGNWTMDVVLQPGSTIRARLELAAPGGARFVGIGLVDGTERGRRLPEVAEELALARALSDLSEELLDAVACDIESGLPTHVPPSMPDS